MALNIQVCCIQSPKSKKLYCNSYMLYIMQYIIHMLHAKKHFIAFNYGTALQPLIFCISQL